MKNIKSLIFWIGIFIMLATTVISNNLSNLDEIWNFNISNGIANGLIPYKDISMISTPLLGFLVAPFFKILGTELFVARIVSIALVFIMLIIAYNVLRKLEISKIVSRAVVMLIALLQLGFIKLDYNYLSLCWALLIILLELTFFKKGRKTFIKDFIIGIIAGLSILTKQSIGVLTCGAIFLSPIFFINKKSEIKQALIHVLFRMIGIIIPVAIFVLYLTINNAFNEFIDYSIKGIKTFSNKINYTNLINSSYKYIKLLSILIPLILIASILFNITMKFRKKTYKNLFILTLYSLPIFLLIYPISDENHFIIAIVPTIILFTYEIMQFIKKYIDKKVYELLEKYVTGFINSITILYIIGISLLLVVGSENVLGNISKYKYIKHFYYVKISEDIYKSINTVDDYINSSEKKVYILDSTASLYMIPLDRYNKNYDLFCVGNFGSGSEEKIIEDIKNEDAKYLILKDIYSRNWQNPEKVRSYIKENMKYIESIDRFDVYENINIEIEPHNNDKINDTDKNNPEDINNDNSENDDIE